MFEQKIYGTAIDKLLRYLKILFINIKILNLSIPLIREMQKYISIESLSKL